MTTATLPISIILKVWQVDIYAFDAVMNDYPALRPDESLPYGIQRHNMDFVPKTLLQIDRLEPTVIKREF